MQSPDTNALVRCIDCRHASPAYPISGQVFCTRLRYHRAPLAQHGCAQFTALTVPALLPPQTY